MLSLTDKQREYWREATHRWNVKCGATRSGKTFLDYYMIPRRIRAMSGKDGLIVILGNTKGTLQRNIIEPLQNIWTPALVSDIRSDNTAYMFGEKVHCIGADKINQVNRLRGSSIAYCYGDEVATWHEDVFTMLKSRLDKDYSCFDGTCNPENPQHWFKKFLDSDADIFNQHYTIYDNDFLSPQVIKALEQEYQGTVFFDRYILGRWTMAEGLIYQAFADAPERFSIKPKALPKLEYITAGVDFGGNKSNHAFVACGIDRSIENVYVLKSVSLPANGVSVEGMIDEFANFCGAVEKKYGKIDIVYADSAEQAIINSMRAKTSYNITNSMKNNIIDRIRCENILIGSGRLYLVEGENDALINGLCNARWNNKSLKDERLDDGSSDIDVLDAFEYSWEYRIKQLIRGGV